MKIKGLFKYFILPIALLLLITILNVQSKAASITDPNPHIIPIPTNPDQSCTSLLSGLLNSLIYDSDRVHITHLTNYKTVNNSFGGYTGADLNKNYYRSFPDPGFHLTGSGNRLISTRIVPVPQPTCNQPNTFCFGISGDQPFDVKQPDSISYDINIDKRKITFNGVYGPYNMNCLDNKFAIVDTGDSIETFTFSKISLPIVR